MTEKSKVHLPNYPEHYERIKEFLLTFKGEDENPKYVAILDQITVRKADFIEIELDDVFEYNQDLGNSIIRNTDRYLKLFYKAIDEILPESSLDFSNQFDALAATRIAAWKESGSENKFPAELHRRHCIHFIPPTKQKILPMREVKADNIGTLVRMRGLVTRISQVKPLLKVAAYTCNQCSEETFQVINTPTFAPLSICQSTQCKASPKPGNLTLQTRGSKFEKFQMIRVQEISSEVPPGHIPRAMTVYSRESLVQKCQSGDVIEVEGIFLPIPMKGYKQSLINETYIEAQKIIVSPKFEESREEEIIDLSEKTNIYEHLSASVAPEIFGLNDVKKSILLQLVGGVTRRFDDGVKIRGDINICLMGDPGVAKSQLLKWVARVAPRSVYTTGRGSSGVGLTAAVLRDPVTGEMALEGGALVLSDMGICCIDEFDKMEESDRTAIYEVMEQQTVSIAKAGITTTLNARTSILAAANPLHSRYNTKKTLLENVNLPSALLSRFDLLFLLLDRHTIESDTSLANHIAYVHQNLSAPTSLSVGLKTLRNHIEKAKQFDPIIPDELTRYLVAAYVEMRQETQGEPITPRSLLAVLRISMALARIRLSSIVAQDDIDEALRLVKSSKESIEILGHEGDRHTDITSSIYEKISNTWRGHKSILFTEIRSVILQSGYTQEQLEKTMDEYERLGIWQMNPGKTKLTFVNTTE